MYELKKIGKLFTSKSAGTGPSSYEKRIYRAAVSQRLRYTGINYVLSGLGFDFPQSQEISCLHRNVQIVSTTHPASY